MALRGTAPIVPVRDLDATAKFYTEVLDFEVVIDNRAHDFMCFRLEEALIALVTAAGDQPLKATRENISAQIWVADVDALWGRWRDKLLALPDWAPDDGPITQPYGTRELHVKCPDGFLMMFTSMAAG